MVANVDKMAFVGETPWHGEGTFLGEAEVDAETMMKASGLTWDVAFAPIFAHVEGQVVPLPKSQAIYRTDTKQILADRVSDRFGIVSPSQHFSFFDEVIGNGTYYHTAGSLGDGEKVWILAKIPSDFSVVKGDDVQSFVLLSDSYAGDGKSFNVQMTPIRVVCQNTLNMALRGGESAGKYRLVHKANIGTRMNAADARGILGLAGGFYDDFKEAEKHLVSQKMTEAEIDAFVNLVAPIPATKMLQAPKELLALPAPNPEQWNDLITPQLRTKRDTIKELVIAGKGNDMKGVKGTKWAAYNGVVEYVDYIGGRDGSRTESLLFGSGRALKQKAWDILIAD